ncbi:MAG TPA: 50S ribosomal protein L22 [Thermoplasmata archaeon]|jgi:large subunit ribosomal protein L22|nr:50S ribosomal protein L22 [Thermoplasmata archaeon]HUS56589.1 50S ribosomal protein L22 [Thermoplasmata archaeon]
MGYTIDADPETTSKAIGKEVSVSPKHCREVCKMLKGRTVEDAKKYLQSVADLKTPVPYTRFKMFLSPKAKVGPGRYPKKAALAIMKVLESARSNAEYKGLDADGMRVKVACANRGRVQVGYMPRAYGRSTPWNEQTTNIEIVLEEGKSSS